LIDDDQPQAPTLAAAVVLFDPDGRVLLVHQTYGGCRWGLPGGRLEPGESPQQAAVREVAEEAGLDVSLDHLVAVYSLRSRRHGLRFIFRGTIQSGVPHPGSDGEISEVAWFGVDDLPANITNSAPFGIRDAAAGSRGAFAEITPPPRPRASV
jgi:8-oxo-dGTP pyrophosphatase MutT (NUDIX family)